MPQERTMDSQGEAHIVEVYPLAANNGPGSARDNALICTPRGCFNHSHSTWML